MTVSRGRLLILQTVNEKEWRAQVIAWAKRSGWEAYFTQDSRNSPSGFPDLVLVRGERLLFAELKTEVGRLSHAQENWLQLLGMVPEVEVYVWRPHDEQQVAEVLA